MHRACVNKAVMRNYRGRASPPLLLSQGGNVQCSCIPRMMSIELGRAVNMRKNGTIRFLRITGGARGGARASCHGRPMRSSHQDRARRVPFPQGAIVHPKHGRGGARRDGQLAEPAQPRLPAHGEAPAVAQMDAGLAPKGHAACDAARGEPQRAARPGCSEGGEPCGQDAAAAAAMAAQPLAATSLKAHGIRRPGQVGQGACVGTRDATRWGGCTADKGQGPASSAPAGCAAPWGQRPDTPRGAAA